MRNSARHLRGFTLVELMVVVVIVGILAAIGLPKFSAYMVEGKLAEATPYLQQIAAKERVYKLRNGSYLADSSYKEDNLVNNLGVSLKEVGDFCFIVVCKGSSANANAPCVDGTNTSLASAPSGIGTVASAPATSGDNPPEFEVWAFLVQHSGATNNNSYTVASPAANSCVTASTKSLPTGWVQASGRASEGRFVVLRYPSPPGRLDSTAGIAAGIGSVNYSWLDGISTSNAMAQ
ncbi:MAG: prepilin-type N-terminal cleavage/methylation domain-containing protein [Alphaproteobacteria bacterium]|nr:prepilin-type N-terminal cleavage/methylation domain-containing protein [Alphaproteobacteria bacterium]